MNYIPLILLLTLFLNVASGFGMIGPTLTNHAYEITSITASAPFPLISSATTANPAMDLLDIYKQSTETHPLVTKMATGGFFAVIGDAVAQFAAAPNSEDTKPQYDTSRALSFAGFDCVYRLVQHYYFQLLIQSCKGQYVGGVIGAIPGLSLVLQNTLGQDGGSSFPLEYYYGAVEQTVASQFGLVPFFYYPVFYIITSFVQGLDKDAAIERARSTFIPLMKRNLLFWIPVQYFQFIYIDEDLQIAFLCAAGLVWTFILSLFAGNAKTPAPAMSEEELVVEMNNSAGVSTAFKNNIHQESIICGAQGCIIEDDYEMEKVQSSVVEAKVDTNDNVSVTALTVPSPEEERSGVIR